MLNHLFTFVLARFAEEKNWKKIGACGASFDEIFLNFLAKTRTTFNFFGSCGAN
jgi:hypothetical protein